MNYIEALKNEDIIKTTTENGDTAFKSTGSYNLDLYSLMGSMRYNYKDLNTLFLRSFYEDKVITTKILLHLRDILKGLGERNSFRMLYNMLANLDPEIARAIIPVITNYGRYDDLLSGFNTPIEKDILKYIEIALDKDLDNLKQNRPISLLAKWLPSINTSNKEARDLAKRIANHLNLSNEEYRKMLSNLRKNLIIENNLREKDYTFDYSKVPSQAMLKYSQAFIRNDFERFDKFLNQVELGEAKINTSTAQVGQVAYNLNVTTNIPVTERFQDLYWKNLPETKSTTKAIVVRDGSSSMTWGSGGLLPSQVATSLALYFSESLPEPFKNHFITFSDHPELIKIPEGTLKEKLDYIKTFDHVENTNISKVYELLLNAAKNGNVSQEDMVEQVIIISDMEFDECIDGTSTFDTYKDKFNKLDLKMPELVFWNVESRNIKYPVLENELGVKLVSGSSQKILELVLDNDLDAITPYDFMLKVLERYNEVDELIIK